MWSTALLPGQELFLTLREEGFWGAVCTEEETKVVFRQIHLLEVWELRPSPCTPCLPCS